MDNKRIRLEDIPKINPVHTPDHYFEDLPQRIQARVQQNPTKVLKPHWTARHSWLTAGAAASVAILMYLSWPTRQDSIGVETLSQLKTEDIVQYLEHENVSLQDLSDTEKNKMLIDSLGNQPLPQVKISNKEIMEQLSLEDFEDVI
ncbi:hypothetical protein [Siphonobacter sp. SORGH_AS_0500]|uniref:hypothetical protein n=1 Tax=Siphonobacter sp. SORGH_AS_0500 TaxID=1864824 RepID=UPI000CB94843|nr:hypothetical protein [Siphonobacter sp. SORGH_AS_0500]MDR6194658.1 hypothetical protein [Siphonobacter sp. SORGH_AS_0500]PKK35494.1 hypothetical protein BWI96_16440 [Siphonobacter sp. SORGH_AS_0500]